MVMWDDAMYTVPLKRHNRYVETCFLIVGLALYVESDSCVNRPVTEKAIGQDREEGGGWDPPWVPTVMPMVTEGPGKVVWLLANCC